MTRYIRHWSVFSILACTLIAVALPRSADAQMTARQLLSTSVEKYDAKYAQANQAIAVFRKGDAAGAREVLAELKEQHPEIAPPDVLLAMLHLAVKQRSQAEAALEQATLQYPEDAEAFVMLAEITLRERRPMVAELAYHRAQEKLKSVTSDAWRVKRLRIRAHAGLASLAESRKQYDQALSHLQAWLKLDEKNPVVFGSLGRVHFQRSDYAAARAAFKDLIRVEPEAPPVEIAMGRLFSDAGMKEEALQSMKTALKADGKDTRTLLTVAEWAISNGHLELARSNLEAVVKLDPDSVGAQVLSGRARRYEGDNRRAEEILTAAILKSPNEFAVSNELARVLAVSESEDQRKAGLAYAKRNHSRYRNPTTSAGREATMTYAWLLLKNDQAKQAEAVLLRLPDASAVSSENAYYAARIYNALGRKKLAAHALRAVLASGTHFPERKQAERLLKELETSDSD